MGLKNQRMCSATVDDTAQHIEFSSSKLAGFVSSNRLKVTAHLHNLRFRNQVSVGSMSLSIVPEMTGMVFDGFPSNSQPETVTRETSCEPLSHRRHGNTLDDLCGLTRIVEPFACLRVDEMGCRWSPRRFANALLHRETKARVAGGRKAHEMLLRTRETCV
jgi:hypothetical protein